MAEILDYSSILLILGLITYYFGRIIGDLRIRTNDKQSYYIQGISFLVQFIIIPSIVILAFQELNVQIEITFPYLLAGLLVIGWLLKKTIKPFIIIQNDLLVETRRRLKKKIKETKNPFIKEALQRSDPININVGFSKFIAKDIILQIFLIVIIYSIIQLPKFTFVEQILITLFSFINLTIIAMLVAYKKNHYPRAEIFLEGGKILDCRIIKFGEYILTTTKDKRILINKDKVIKIEMSKLKSK